MKKILLFAVTAGFVFNSCSDDDDEGAKEFSMVGLWGPSREIIVSGSNGVTISNKDSSPCYKNSTFNFHANNTMSSQIFSLTNAGDCESSDIETVPYSYDHAAKKLIIDGELTEIVSRTENELHIVTGYNDEDGDGIDDKIILVMVKH